MSSVKSAVRNTPAVVRLKLSSTARKAVLVVHVVSSVGLMGHLIAALAIGLVALADHPLLSGWVTWYQEALTPAVGASLSLVALFSGVVLGLATKWGVIRYDWVTLKLVLLVGVIVAGMVAAGEPAVAAAQWVALLVATVMSVFKPRQIWS